jgi:hypothetical protein
MARRALLAVLALATAIEAALALGGFFARDLVIAQFHVGVNDDTRFLGSVLAWMLLFVTAVCALAFAETRRGNRVGTWLCYGLGLWWVGIGLHLALGFGRFEHLVLDAGKGLLIALLAWRASAQQGVDLGERRR